LDHNYANELYKDISVKIEKFFLDLSVFLTEIRDKGNYFWGKSVWKIR